MRVFGKKFLVLVLWGGLILKGATGQSAEPTFFPPNKSVVSEKKILFIYQGSAPLEPASLTLELNGEKLKAGLKYLGNLLYAPLTLKEGGNALQVTQGGQVWQLAYVLQPEDKPLPADYAAFRFHESFLGGDCADCHDLKSEPLSFKNLVAPKKEAVSICVECHDDRLKAEYIHGPLGSGDCSPCHDAHGSQQLHLLKTATADLCFVCHEKEQAQSHLDKLKKTEKDATVCLSCHEPHGTDKKFHLR